MGRIADRPKTLPCQHVIDLRSGVAMAMVGAVGRQFPQAELHIRRIDLAALVATDQRLPACHREGVDLPR